ncbi:MAG: Uma2 family endonuclease [Gloeomargarita sp. SKYBB_i_bin120]|nr:Uma2 family endonuclease [Gloeomargarita sp. SKYG98]MCS7293398.1 Uma2 family endonuclease [Gloeomargarita sp. SKYB120]MDW8178963.1 Uma2 family endonuclease [Gloeomargarita sp. SKYBB_i_bin120]
MRTTAVQPGVVYPERDGRPMADNTLQFRWIVLIKENLEWLLAERSDVFVAGDLLWYPVEGHPEIRTAPDVMVVFGRPKGERGSYRQWEEGNIPPQVVFEILSPGNRLLEMLRKWRFYERYGVEEFYVYEPNSHEFSGFLRGPDGLDEIADMNGWVSPRLGIKFELNPDGLVIYTPSGERFKTTVELAQELQRTEQQLLQTQTELERERQRAERLAAYLRRQGINPEEIGGWDG